MNRGSATKVLTRVETASAMAMVTASSLLIGNLLLLPELCAVSSSSSVDLVLGELGGVGGVVWLACAEFAASLPSALPILALQVCQ